MGKFVYGGLIALALALAGCGRPSDPAVEHALEQAWEGDTIGMEVHIGMLTREQAAGLNGARSTAHAALGVLRAYAGDTIGDLAADAAGTITEFTGEMGGTAAAPMARHVALMTARDWDVTNINVLQSRRSGAEYVVKVRYDVAATIAGRRQSVGRDLTQTLRLEKRNGDWAVVPTNS